MPALHHADEARATPVRNWMAEYGERLIDGGYPIIPIVPGAKCPGQYSQARGWEGYKNWSRHCDRPTKAFEVDIWRRWPGCGIGVPCGGIVAADLDVLDGEAVTKIEAAAKAELGDTPAIRIGQAPKRLLVYRTARPFAPIKRHPIEILAHGSQFVAYATHPGTGEPYHWPIEDLCELPLSELPVVTEEQCRRFLDIAAELVPPHLRQNRLGPERRAELYYSGGDPRGTLPAMTAALEHIPNDDLHYDDWIRIAYSLKIGLGEEGLPLFAEWSARSRKNVAAFTLKTWNGLRPRGEITAGTVYEHALARGWIPDHDMILNGGVAEAMAGGGGSAAERIIAKAVARMEAEAPPPVPVELPVPASPPPAVDDVVANAGGILGELVDWMNASARFPQPLLALGAALTVCGALMGHKYRLLNGPDTRSNIMILALAGSGSGKDHPRRCMIAALHRAGLIKFYHGRDMASAQGITANLSDFFSGVALVDEAGHFFAKVMHERAPAHLKAISSVLTELSTSATSMFVDAAKAGNRDPDAVRYDIPDPCFNLFATTVPEPLWAAMNSGHAIDGFLARFLMFETSLNYPDPQFDAEPLTERLDAIAASLRRLVVGPGVEPTDFALMAALGNMQPAWKELGHGKRARVVRPPDVPVVPMSIEAQEADRAIAIDEVTRKRANEGKTLATSIIARTTEHVRRLALIRAVSRNPFAPLVEGEDMAWGMAVVELSQARIIPAVEAHVADTAWEASLKKLLNIIKKHGDWIDMSTLSDRCYFLKSRDRNDMIIQLLESGRLESRKELTTTKPRTFVRLAGKSEKPE